MATSIGRYAPVLLPGESPSVTEKPGRPGLQVAKYQTWLKKPCVRRFRTFCVWQLCPSESWVWMGRSCLACRALAAPRVPGHRLPPCRSHGPVRVFSRPSCCRPSEGLFGQYFSVALPIQGLRGLPCLGSFSVDWSVRQLKGPPGRGRTL